MNALTEHSLGVIWWIDGKGHEEVDGVIVYGYWERKPNVEPTFPAGVWPKSTLVKSSYLYDVDGEKWFDIIWDIRIFEWPKPDEWEGVLKKTLMCMLEAGAKVAWCGMEGNIGEPLFDPAAMIPSGVYAALSPEFGFKCTAKLGMPYQGFKDEDLLKLRSIVGINS